MTRHAFSLFMATIFASPLWAKPPLEIVTATYLGTPEDDDLQGVIAAADGTLYVAGNTGTAAANLPGGVQPAAFGSPAKEPRCGFGFVAHLSVGQNEPCPDIGTEVASVFGDADCSGNVNSVDALKILRFVAHLPVAQDEPCVDIGGVLQ